jgi:hypothetical protein
MSSALEHGHLTNRQETQKLYSLILPYSLYDNPYKQYSRKVKLKRQQNNVQNSIAQQSTEFMIISSYWTGTALTAISSTPSLAPIVNNRNNVGGGETSLGVGGGGSIKTRKKMKITSGSLDGETEIPKHSNLQNMGEEEPATNIIILKPVEYEKMNSAKYSLADLRALCTHYSIKKSGTKPDLTQRLYTFLKQTYFILRIQRSFKTFLSKKYRDLCGPGYLHTSKCVNDTDFYTFDKLSNIKPMELFTYLDSDNKIYGFHIASIFHLIITSYPTITNPYNRNVIPSSIIKNVYEKLIYGSLMGFRVSVKLEDEDNDDNNNNDQSGYTNVAGGVPVISREKQEELFIVDLFQHINTLGNYADSDWFIALQREELVRFIRNIHDIWYYRANLSQEMKERICPPHGNPFVLHNAHVNLNVITLLTSPEIRTICVSVIDRMTRRGAAREDQCLGAFYVLATLTIVNQDARNALPWLYEAVV